jgi:hypothetical protein
MMKYSVRTIAFIGTAPIAALMAALLTHAVRIPPFAVRDDSLVMAACLTAFVAAELFAQWRGRR